MNKTQALNEAVKRWGKNAAVRDLGKKIASTPESRAAAQAKLKELNGLPDAEKRARRNERHEAVCASYRFRYTVGEIAMGIAFAVHGSGDTWEEAFHEADCRFVNKAA